MKLVLIYFERSSVLNSGNAMTHPLPSAHVTSNAIGVMKSATGLMNAVTGMKNP
jgi:hypothetical protein